MKEEAWRYHYVSAAAARASARDGSDGGGAYGFIKTDQPIGHSDIIAFAPHHRDPAEDKWHEENLRLIAAAPTLLKVLCDVAGDSNCMKGFHEQFRHQIRDALKLATEP